MEHVRPKLILLGARLSQRRWRVHYFVADAMSPTVAGVQHDLLRPAKRLFIYEVIKVALHTQAWVQTKIRNERKPLHNGIPHARVVEFLIQYGKCVCHTGYALPI